MKGRKEELKRRARRGVRKQNIIVGVALLFAIVGTVYLHSKFIMFNVMVPERTLTAISSGVGFSIILIGMAWLSNNRKINVLIDLVVEIKMFLQDTVEHDSITMDEILKIKNKIDNYLPTVRR